MIELQGSKRMWLNLIEAFGSKTDVTAPCDQQIFRSFDNFLKNSSKSDVALQHEFTRYQSRKNYKETAQADPAGRKKGSEMSERCVKRHRTEELWPMR